MSLIFISYTKDDGMDLPERWRQRLEQAGVPAWFDKDLPPGERWQQAIDSILERCDVVIVLVTPNSFKSQWVGYEWAKADGLGKTVIPLIIEEIPSEDERKSPLFLLQYINFIDDFDDSWSQLLERLRKISEEKPHQQVVNAEITLETSHKPEEWSSAIYLLRHHPHKSATFALQRQVNNDFPKIAIDAGIALAKRTNFKDTVALIGLEKSYGTGTREEDEALKIICTYNNADAVSCLERILENAPEGDKYRIIRHLTSIRHQSVIEPCRRIIRDKRQGALDAANALGELQATEALPELLDLLQRSAIETPANFHSYRGTIRAFILQVFTKLGTPSAIPDLINLLEIYTSTEHQQSPQDIEAFVKTIYELGGNDDLVALLASRKTRGFNHFKHTVSNALESFQRRTN